MTQAPATIVIVGPTAGGKTEVSLELATRLPRGGECVCADSMQVYRGMDIGTAKPTAAQRKRVKHHLLDVIGPNEPFNVDHWLVLAEAACRDIASRGRHPILVGGTNLYVQSFLRGMMDGPPPDEPLRQALANEELGDLRAELERVDPAAAARIHANDSRRTIRAIEVFRLTGTPISAHQGQWDQGPRRKNVVLLGLHYPAPVINPRINQRVREMMAAGLLQEVTDLMTRGALGPQAIEALGYRQLVDHLEGRGTLEEAVEQIKIRTRRFAKHQRTWLKRFLADFGGQWIQCHDLEPQMIVNKALSSTSAALENGSENQYPGP